MAGSNKPTPGSTPIGGSGFVFNITTQYDGRGANEAYAAEERLKDIFGKTNSLIKIAGEGLERHAALKKQLSTATKEITKHFKGFADELKNVNKLSWLGVAGGFALGNAFAHAANFALRAAGNVSILGKELYYMNRRLNEPGTRTLFNIAFAGAQIGLSPEQVLGTTESMGATARLNPGVAALLSRFIPGYKPGGPLGGKQQLDLVNNLKNRFGEGGYYMAAQFANMFGFNNELEFRTMWTNLKELNDAYVEYDRTLKNLNVDTDLTSKNFAEFHRALNKLGNVIDAIATKGGAWFARNFATPIIGGMATALSNPNSWGLWGLLASQSAGLEAGIMPDSNPPSGNAPINALIGTARENAISNFMAMGLSRNMATGFAYGLHAESGSRRGFIDYTNSNNIGGGHYGIMQWGKTRQANFGKMFGHPISQSTPQEQWQFLAYEAGGGDPGTYEAFNWAKMHPNASASQATDIWNKFAENPGHPYGADIYNEANRYATSHQTVNDIDIAPVTVNVHSNGDTASATGAALGAVLDKWTTTVAQSMRQAKSGANIR